MGRLSARATVTETVKTELQLKPSVEKKLRNELRSYQDCHTEGKACKTNADYHRSNILGMENEIGEKKFKFEGFSVILTTDAEDVRLDKEKLVKFMVQDGYTVEDAKALLKKAERRKPKKPFATIRVPGENEEDE